MAYTRPGTYVDEVLPASQVAHQSSTSIAAVVGAALRGPTVPVLLTSWPQAKKYFGDFVAGDANNVLHAIYQAFDKGAGSVWAVRPTGTGATAATRVFSDTAVVPAQALDVTAANPGVWANTVYVEILAASSNAPDKFNLVVRLVPTGAAITNGQIIEQFKDLSLSSADSRYVVAVVNSASIGSSVIRVAPHTGYTVVSGTYLAKSTSAGGDPLAGGANGAAPTRAQKSTSLYTLDAVNDSLVINLPGETNKDVINDGVDYCDSARTRTDLQPGRGDCFLVVDGSLNVDETAAITVVDGADPSAPDYHLSSFYAVYYPGLLVPDPTSSISGATVLIPPGGAVLGSIIATDSSRGFFKAPAGIGNVLKGVIGLDPAATLRNPQLDALAASSINAIRRIPGVGFCIFGARTRLPNRIDKYINARRTLINARIELKNRTRFATFENNDEVLWANMHSAADKYCRELWQQGGLKGSTQDAAYYIVCDSSINSDVSIDDGEVHIEVGLALQRPAEFVVIRIAQFDGGSAAVETTV